MARRVRWGVLGAASIALRRAIPGMRKGEWCEIAAIASRDLGKAKRAAESLGIPKAYGSYEELLDDSSIEAIYNPLPNTLHVPWTIRAAEAGKHVLCEKPIGVSAADAERLIAARDRAGVKIEEALMVRTHPRWLRARELIRGGRIGELRVVSSFISYFNVDRTNIRNSYEERGGALLDIGCYSVTLSRFLFGSEPVRVMASIERDPEMKTDRVTSAILEFPGGRATFTCSTQVAYNQRFEILGASGKIGIERPLNPPVDEPTRISIDDNPSDPTGSGVTAETFAACDQFTIQGDLFSRAVREGGEVAVPLEDSVRNMRAIDAIFRSGESGQWEGSG
ncbi:MAG TPA: Gfo/Idh/MocA family oxidoreductase [Candidatus Baltobacteraceae bacterium]|nr:Gfo/Idh/MocA family oxidoreductase [Candidatus Baltobacteraceae bacterium]